VLDRGSCQAFAGIPRSARAGKPRTLEIVGPQAEEFDLRLLFAAFVACAANSSAMAQGTVSVTRPAGVGFSVSTGIGSSATLTTHAPDPPSDFKGKARITGLLPYVPEPAKKKDEGDKDHAVAKVSGAPIQTSNMIRRDRIESPHDAAFSKDNYFRQQEDARRSGR
jgi:hypothetical protein